MDARTIFSLAAITWSLVVSDCLAQPTPGQKRDTTLSPPENSKSPLARGYTIPTIDISAERARQTIVDRKAGQYLGHPTTVLLEDGKTMLIVYPKGHGRGAVVY